MYSVSLGFFLSVSFLKAGIPLAFSLFVSVKQNVCSLVWPVFCQGKCENVFLMSTPSPPPSFFLSLHPFSPLKQRYQPQRQQQQWWWWAPGCDPPPSPPPPPPPSVPSPTPPPSPVEKMSDVTVGMSTFVASACHAPATSAGVWVQALSRAWIFGL